MGNIVPIDGEKKQKIEEIAQDFMSTFGEEFVLAYGVEFTKMKLKQIDEETYGMADRKKELMYRKEMELTDPHKMGILTKKGAVVKTWKKRYFVVNPDYTVSYYNSEEAHHKGSKPKGIIRLAGYKVEENANSAQAERLKALMKILGCEDKELPVPHMYSEHTFTLMHKRRRVYYITPADEDDKIEWIDMFRTCCFKATGFKNEDPLSQLAFKTAHYRACQKSGHFTRRGDCAGTEEQVLSETIVEIINDRIMSSVYSDLTGNFTIRRKLRKQVMKALDSLVLAMVIPSYKALVESTQTLIGPLEKIVDEKIGEVADVQRKITQALSEKLEKIFNETAKEISTDIKKMFDELRELTGRASAEMKNECVVRLLERLISETSESNDVESLIAKHFKIFDKVALSVRSWDHWYKVWNIEKESLEIIAKYKPFEEGGQYSLVYEAHDMLNQGYSEPIPLNMPLNKILRLEKVADGAFYTFEEYLKERTKETELLKENKKAAELMESVKNDIISKYDADLTATPEEISFKLTTIVVVQYVTQKINPLIKDILKEAATVIPDPVQKIISIDDRYDLYVEECVKHFIRKAVGIARVEKMNRQEEEKEEEKPGEKESEKKEIKVEGDNEEKAENPEQEEMNDNSEGIEGKEEETEGGKEKKAEDVAQAEKVEEKVEEEKAEMKAEETAAPEEEEEETKQNEENCEKAENEQNDENYNVDTTAM